MEYKVLHSTTANLESDLAAAAAEGWELFDTPQAHRQPGTPEQWLIIMERDVTTGMDWADGVTLAAIQSWADGIAQRNLPEPVSDHAKGYGQAVKDVQAILKMHGQPAGVPVISSRP